MLDMFMVTLDANISLEHLEIMVVLLVNKIKIMQSLVIMVVLMELISMLDQEVHVSTTCNKTREVIIDSLFQLNRLLDKACMAV